MIVYCRYVCKETKWLHMMCEGLPPTPWRVVLNGCTMIVYCRSVCNETEWLHVWGAATCPFACGAERLMLMEVIAMQPACSTA